MAEDRVGPPFLLKLFYRTGAFHRPDEFTSLEELPQHMTIHTWSACTLNELSHHLAGANPPVLPDPAIGTRLSFRLIFADTRNNPTSQPRYIVKDLGSIVIGAGGPGILGPDEDSSTSHSSEPDDTQKTLADAKFVAGDYISVAILPSDPETGEIAGRDDARTGRGAGIGEAVNAMTMVPPPQRDHAPPSFGRGRGSMRGAPRGRGGGPSRWRDGSDSLLSGEWRRGERLPEAPMGRGRGSFRGRGREREEDYGRDRERDRQPRW